MMTWIKLAVRNLFRNRRRSLFTILAISLGFAAVNVLGGFTDYIFSNLENSYIHVQANGHLTIFKPGFLKEGKLDPTRYLLDEDSTKAIKEILHRYPEVLVVTPQLHISGLLSNGKVSTIFIASGRIPSDIRTINSYSRGLASKFELFTGKPLEDDIVYGVGLSRGLAEQLNLDLGVTAVAMAPTVSGQVNALDAQVFQLFTSPIEALDDKFMLVPLKFAQSLYDTTSVDRITVLLENTAQTEPVRRRLAQDFATRGLSLEIKSWNELSTFYVKVKQMFDIIFLFTFLIVFTIVVMSVINTVSMAIMERTREIGTLRALGLKRGGIVVLFAIESLMLGLFGSFLGVILTLLTWSGIAFFKPTWVPPMITGRVPLEIYLVPEYMVYSVLLLGVLSLMAATLPARKAAKMQIVSALGHT
ncbi:MAG TPA: FtsX-like permease family protein [Methylococcus sp.]|nr:FtsX-like permease family protein [Methylococcus sp.]